LARRRRALLYKRRRNHSAQLDCGIASTPDHGNLVEAPDRGTQLAENSSTNANVAHRNLQMVPRTPRDGKALWHAESNAQHNNFKFAWPDLDIPTQWNSVFTYTLNFGSDWSGIPKGEYPSVEIRGERLQTSRQKLDHLGRDAGHHPGASLLRVDDHGGPVRLVKVGSVTTIMPDFAKNREEPRRGDRFRLFGTCAAWTCVPRGKNA
jgi:hypothetical protein